MPVYEDNSLATMLSQLELGVEIPEELYTAIVEVYVYFLNFDPSQPDGKRKLDEPKSGGTKTEEQKPEVVEHEET